MTDLGLIRYPNCTKDDLHASSAELVYGEPLTVPGSFVTPNTVSWSLLDPLNILKAVPTSSHSNTKTHVPDDILSAKYAFIRHDSHRTPLQRPYDGPYEVIATRWKTFRIRVGGIESVIYIDRLKPAHSDHTTQVTVGVPPRRGRPPINPPKLLIYLCKITNRVLEERLDHLIRYVMLQCNVITLGDSCSARTTRIALTLTLILYVYKFLTQCYFVRVVVRC